MQEVLPFTLQASLGSAASIKKVDIHYQDNGGQIIDGVNSTFIGLNMNLFTHSVVKTEFGIVRPNMINLYSNNDDAFDLNYLRFQYSIAF